MSEGFSDPVTYKYKCNAKGCFYSTNMKPNLTRHRNSHKAVNKSYTLKWKK